jgi:hypothetical protein
MKNISNYLNILNLRFSNFTVFVNDSIYINDTIILIHNFMQYLNESQVLIKNSSKIQLISCTKISSFESNMYSSMNNILNGLTYVPTKITKSTTTALLVTSSLNTPSLTTPSLTTIFNSTLPPDTLINSTILATSVYWNEWKPWSFCILYRNRMVSGVVEFEAINVSCSLVGQLNTCLKYLFQIFYNFCNILVAIEDSILIQTNRRDKCINETITIKNITNTKIIKLKDAYKATAYGITSLVSIVIIFIVLFL